jgi:hypothetical protein
MTITYESNKKWHFEIWQNLIKMIEKPIELRSLSTPTVVPLLYVINGSGKCHKSKPKKQFSSKFIPILERLDLIDPKETFIESNITDHVKPIFKLYYEKLTKKLQHLSIDASVHQRLH